MQLSGARRHAGLCFRRCVAGTRLGVPIVRAAVAAVVTPYDGRDSQGGSRRRGSAPVPGIPRAGPFGANRGAMVPPPRRSLPSVVLTRSSIGQPSGSWFCAGHGWVLWMVQRAAVESSKRCPAVDPKRGRLHRKLHRIMRRTVGPPETSAVESRPTAITFSRPSSESPTK